ESGGIAVRFRKRAATDPVDDVDVELDSIDSLTDGGTTLDQDEDDEDADAEVADVPEVDSSELSTIDPTEDSGELPAVAAEDFARIRPPVVPYKPGRAATVALSEEDLEEVREAARMGTHAQRPASMSM